VQDAEAPLPGLLQLLAAEEAFLQRRDGGDEGEEAKADVNSGTAQLGTAVQGQVGVEDYRSAERCELSLVGVEATRLLHGHGAAGVATQKLTHRLHQLRGHRQP
jgi:hypothetical protein